MATSTVKWFSLKVGYGFIQLDTGESCFVHNSDIEMDGFKTLKVGQDVKFIKTVSEDGTKGCKVVPL